MIARNEERNLPRALRSFEELCDEIIVVDTGSTDSTVDIGRQLGARVVSFSWNDDFSAARNFCIDHANGDWIFWLDSDEQLLPQSREMLRECMNHDDVSGWYVLRQDLVRADREDLFTEMWQLRLFRRDPALRFVGRCHPHFEPPLELRAGTQGMLVEPSQIRLRHWGYVAEMMPAKLARAARLLRLELLDRPGQLYYEIELARTLLTLGEKREGMRYLAIATTHLLEHRDDPLPPSAMAAALLEYLLAMPEESARQIIDPAELATLCDRWFPRCAPLLWVVARRSFEHGDYSAAAARLETLIELGRCDAYDKSISFDPRIIREDARLNLAACYIRLAELDRAEQTLLPLAQSPRALEVQHNLEMIRRLRAQREDPRGK